MFDKYKMTIQGKSHFFRIRSREQKNNFSQKHREITNSFIEQKSHCLQKKVFLDQTRILNSNSIKEGILCNTNKIPQKHSFKVQINYERIKLENTVFIFQQPQNSVGLKTVKQSRPPRFFFRQKSKSFGFSDFFSSNKYTQRSFF